jgi:protein gp37
MRRASWHVFQVLTKRADRLAKLSSRIDWPDNVWSAAGKLSWAGNCDQRCCGVI